MKIKEIYNIDSIQKLADSANDTRFKDSDSGIILARSLTAVDPTIFEKKFPELVFMNSGITMNNTGGYVQEIQSLRRSITGSFSQAGDRSDDKNKISITGEDSKLNVHEFEAQSAWTDTEIKQAELEGRNLVTELLEAHNKIYMRELDEGGYTGIAGNDGLLNFSGYTATAAAGAIGTLTAQEMYDEISTLIIAQWNAVGNTAEYKANRLDTSITVINTLAETILNTAAGASTVLSALKANFPNVTFSGTFRAEDVGGTSKTCAYNNGGESMQYRLPEPLTIGEIIRIGSFKFQVDSKYRNAGLDILETTSGRILTGL